MLNTTKSISEQAKSTSILSRRMVEYANMMAILANIAIILAKIEIVSANMKTQLAKTIL